MHIRGAPKVSPDMATRDQAEAALQSHGNERNAAKRRSEAPPGVATRDRHEAAVASKQGSVRPACMTSVKRMMRDLDAT